MLPHPRYQSPIAPIVSVCSGTALAPSSHAEGQAAINRLRIEGNHLMMTRPSPTASLMLTVGRLQGTQGITDDMSSLLREIASGEFDISLHLSSIVPSVWTSKYERTRVLVGGAHITPPPQQGGVSCDEEGYPLCSPHPASARSFAMLDVMSLSEAQYARDGYVVIDVSFETFVSQEAAHPPPSPILLLVCWCEAIDPSTIIKESIRLAREKAALITKALGGQCFPVAKGGPLSTSTQQQLAVTTDAGDDDDIQFIGTSTSAAHTNNSAVNYSLTSTTPIISRVPASFRCPLTYALMTVPGRGIHCSHLASAFDIGVYIRHCLFATNSWNCPLCGAEVRHTDIVVVSAIEDAMLSYGPIIEEDDCDGCYILVDTSNTVRGPIVAGWEPSEAACEQMRLREVDDEGDDDDEDYDRHRARRAPRRNR